ncbi:MAG TPA: ABC transporter substrate-binding protein [Iamia sp.]|jgi:taurine transport system substrate-binding protein|nr:ABC transporter substrate-binding protein [Iamia sp.]
MHDHVHHRRRRRPFLALLAILALLLAVAACGDDDEPAASDDSGSGSEETGGAPETITIGYQLIPNGDLVVKGSGWLEEAFPDSEIEWKLFDSGGSVNEAIIGGSIDFGLAGSSPVSRGISTGIEYQVPWIHDVIGEAEALVVNPDTVSGIDDLAGKTIATPFASTSHFSLLAALDDAGVDPADVDIIDAEPDDIFAAWSRGDIDGAYVWNPNLASIIDDGGEVLITSADLAAEGTTTYDLAVVSNGFAEEFPEAVQTWVEQQDRAVKLIQDEPDDAADVIAAELDIDAEAAAAQIEDLIFLDASEQAAAENLGGGLAENLLAAAEFNVEQGEIPEAKPAGDYEAAVNASFAEAVG